MKCNITETIYRRKAAEAIRNLERIKMGKKFPKKFVYKEDPKMRSFGDIDFDTGVIRVNPRKGEIIDTILHEEAHRKFPDLSEPLVRKMVSKQIQNMSLRDQANVVLTFLRKSKRSKKQLKGKKK